jgi:hypothetical protein
LQWWKTRAQTGEWLLAEAHHHHGQLAARVESMQRHQVESMLIGKLHSPADIWHYVDMPALLTDGNVDAGKLDETCSQIVSTAPYLAKTYPAAPSNVVTANDPIDYDAEGAQSFQQLLRAAARGGRGVETESLD